MPWLAFALISAVLFSLNDIIRKEALMKVKPYPFVLGFSILGVIIFAPIAYLNADIFVPQNILYMLAFLSVLNAASTILIIEAFSKWEASKVAPLENLSPLFLVVLAYVFLGEILSSNQLFGIFLIVGGAIFLEWEEHFRLKEMLHKSKDRTIILHILGALFIWSVMSIITKQLLQTIDAYTLLLFVLVFTAMIFTGWIAVTQRKVLRETLESFKKNRKFMFGSTILDYSSYLFILWAIAVPGALVALIIPVRRLSTLFTVVFGGKLLHEHRLKERAAASLIMIVGVYFVAA